MSSTITSSNPGTSSTTSTTPSSTDDAYTFTFTETEVRNIAMAIGISLATLLIIALIAIEVMRRKIKRLNKQLSIYEYKGFASTSKVGGGYEQIPISTLETGSVMRAELDGAREVVESDGRILGDRAPLHGRDESFVVKLDNGSESPHRMSSRETLC